MKKYKGDTLCGGSVTHTQPEKSVENKNETIHGKRNFRWAPNIGFGKVRSMLGSIIKRRS